MTAPNPALDHAGIVACIPHSGAMCLLQAVLDWSADAIHCSAVNQADPANPLRSAGALPAVCAIEYAAQAMAVHAALCAAAGAVPGGTPGASPSAGFLASARAVRLWVARLDDAAGPLHVHALRLAGNGTQAMYRFELLDASQRMLVEGRLTVVLNSPLTVEPA